MRQRKPLALILTRATDLERGMNTTTKIPPSANFHPCNAWALSAGQQSWAAALEVMTAGRVLRGRAPMPGAKSMGFMNLFFDEVHAQGLHGIADDLGMVRLGLRGSFSQEDLDRQARWEKVRRLGGGWF